MKALFDKYKWLRIVIGAAILAAGITTTILAIKGTSNLAYVISLIAAVCCFLYAAALILISFIKSKRTPFPIEVLIGGVFIGIGITLCIPEVSQDLAKFIIYILASVLIALGAVAIIKGIIILCYKDPVWNWLLLLICGVVSLVGGVLLAIFRDDVKQTIETILGILICVIGTALIVIGIVDIAKSRKAKKKQIESK